MGTVRRVITPNITGMSITRDALIPPTSTPTGTEKGAIEIAIPLTSTRLKRFAPIRLPRDSAPRPFISDVIAVTSSGREVPSATKVSAITVSGTPKVVAMKVPLFTKRSAPTAITAAPRMRKRRSFQRGEEFSSSLGCKLSSGSSSFI